MTIVTGISALLIALAPATAIVLILLFGKARAAEVLEPCSRAPFRSWRLS